MLIRTGGVLVAIALCAVCAQFIGGQTLTQSNDPNTVTAGSVGCVNGLGLHADNSFYRAYNIATTTQITAVRFAVEEDSGAPNPINLRIHSTSTPTGTPTLASLTQLNSTSIRTPGNGTWSLTIRTINLSQAVQVTAGQRIVVELNMPNNQGAGGSFFIGSNAAGQSAPAYLFSPCTGAGTAIVDLTTVAPNMHIILDLVTVPTAPNPEIDVQRPNLGPAGTIASGATNVFAGCFAGGGTGNITYTIANQGLSTALNVSSVVIGTPVNCTPGTPTFAGSVAAGANTTLTIPITSFATGVGSFSFTVTINNTDANEGVYTFTCVGGRGLTGTVSIAPTGGSYTDLGLAFNDMEDFGVAGNLILEVAAGTYTPTANYELGSDFSGGGNFDEVPVSNTANTVTIRAAVGATVNIQGGPTQACFEGLNGLESGLMSIVGVSNLTVERLNFIGGAGSQGFGLTIGSRPASAQQVIGVTVRQCTMTGIVNGSGLWLVGDGLPLGSVTVENCTIRNCGAGNTAYGSNAMPGALGFFFPGSNVFVRHCTVVNNAGVVAATGQQGAPGAVGWRGNVTFMTPPDLQFNIFTSSTSAFPIFHFNGAVAAAPPNPALPAEFPTVCNRNVFFLSGGANFAIESGATPTVRATFTAWRTQYPALDANSVEGDPLFVSGTDLHINAGSPALELATTSTVNVDIDGDTRPNGAQRDSGSDERTGAAASPSLTIVATDSAAAEATPATATGTYTITASSAPASALTVSFTMSGTAAVASGTDYNLSGSTIAYTTGPNGTFTFPASVTSTTITLTPVDDAAAESSETAIMTLNAGAGYTVGAPANGTVNIADNDTTGTPAVSVVATDSAAAEATPANQTGTFTITLSPVSASAITLNFTMSGTASTTPGTDYNLSGTGVTWTGPGGTIAVPASTASVTVTLTPVDDTAVESAETAIMTINTGTGYTVGSPSNGTVNIADNDSAGVLTIVTTTLPNGVVGTAYNATITAQNGTGPYTWSLASGTLPTGLTLNTAATGLTTSISGTPTAAGVFTFTVQVADSAAATDTQLYNVTITSSGGGGGGVGGGGGGGGGCAADGNNSQWVVLAAVLGLLFMVVRKRRTA